MSTPETFGYLKWDETQVKVFWAFVVERHNIYYRRFVLPDSSTCWTDDPILRKYRFTNIYRELDKGTQFVINHLLPAARSYPELAVFNVMAYRKFNLPSTHRALASLFGRFPDHPLVLSTWDTTRATEELQRMQQHGVRIQSAAFMINAIEAKHGGLGSGIALQCRRIGDVWDQLGEFCAQLASAKSMQEAHGHIMQFSGYAGFMAYEVVIDLNYSPHLLRFSEDDWVHPGPGCMHGLDLMLEWDRMVLPHSKRRVYEDAIRELRNRQRVGLNTPHRVWPLEKELTLRNVEHSLCEFYKYVRIQRGGHATRRFS